MAAAFDRVAAAAPAELRADAEDVATGYHRLAAAVGDLADGKPGAAARIEAAMSDLLVVLGTPVDEVTADGQAQVRYDNAFLAWIAEPCGPKPLVADDPNSMTFNPVGEGL
jgi:hypothetical protein